MPGYNVLFKVRYAMTTLMTGIHKAWSTGGKHVTIDESMISYMGRAVSFVQYMPAKPIKHDIKVYALAVLILRCYWHFKYMWAKKTTRRIRQ